MIILYTLGLVSAYGIACVSSEADAIVAIVLSLMLLVLLVWGAVSTETGKFSHALAATAHAVSCLVFAILVTVNDVSWEPTVGYTYNETFVEIDTHVPIRTVLVSTSFLSGVFHVLAAFFFQQYEVYFRWKDYSLSSPPMLVIISLLCGVTDVFALTSIAIAQTLSMWVVYVVQTQWTGDKRDVLPGGFSETVALLFVFQTILWTPAFSSFGYALTTDTPPPDVASAVLSVMFLLFMSFGVVFVLEKSDQVSAKTSNVLYISLSFGAKISLKWMVYSGMKGRSADGGGFTTAAITILLSVCLGVLNYVKETCYNAQ